MRKAQLELFEEMTTVDNSDFRRQQGLHGVAKLRQTLSTANQRCRDVA
ncbi:MAG: hypothetical protein ACYCWN_09370 [Ferrimicrobium sp.]|nr:hypothetical protein [Ferrimicrobium sp.]